MQPSKNDCYYCEVCKEAWGLLRPKPEKKEPRRGGR
jgi:hypothetical protein